LIAIIFVGLSSCDSTSSEDIKLKENEILREQVYDQILGDRELTTDPKKLRKKYGP